MKNKFIDGNSKIFINNDFIPIRDFFELTNFVSKIKKLKNGVEVIYPLDAYFTKSLYGFTKIKSVSRRKVKDKKVSVRVKNNEVKLTIENTIMVFRNNFVLETASLEVLPADALFILNNIKTMKIISIPFLSTDIKIKEDGVFEDEYVYNLEVEDQSHSYIANNILIHDFKIKI